MISNNTNNNNVVRVCNKVDDVAMQLVKGVNDLEFSDFFNGGVDSMSYIVNVGESLVVPNLKQVFYCQCQYDGSPGPRVDIPDGAWAFRRGYDKSMCIISDKDFKRKFKIL